MASILEAAVQLCWVFSRLSTWYCLFVICFWFINSHISQPQLVTEALACGTVYLYWGMFDDVLFCNSLFI